MKWRARPRKKPRSLHLTLTATDEEWELVRRNAALRNKSIARYLVDLCLGEDAGAEDRSGTKTGTEVTLEPSEQRRAMEILERMHRHVWDENAQRLVDDIQSRVAIILNSWAHAMVAGGRSAHLRDSMIRIVGKEQAERFMENLGTEMPEPETRANSESSDITDTDKQNSTGNWESPKQDSLF